MKNEQIIIKKVKGKGHGGGHHGGEWKVAYADFITAMMAFFLLMWLIAILSPEKKQNMAHYFRDFGFLQQGGQGGTGFLNLHNGILGTQGANKSNIQIGFVKSEGKYMSQEEMRDQLKKDIETKLTDVKDQVMVDIFEGGIRIQVIDKDGNPMFALGSPELTAAAKKILKVITNNIKDQANDVSIEGHTDALNYSTSRYTNWELSTERASAARKELEAGGLNPNHLIRVAGYASKEPLIKDNPNDPRNRRISIILLYNSNKDTQLPLPGSGLPSELIGDYKKNKPIDPFKGSS